MTVAALLIVGVSLVSASTVEFRSAINQSHSTQAFYVAEAGLNWARRTMVPASLPTSGNTPHILYRSIAFGGDNTALAEIGELDVTVTRIADGRWELRSTGLQHQARRTVSWHITQKVPTNHQIEDEFSDHPKADLRPVPEGESGLTYPSVTLPQLPAETDRGNLTVSTATTIAASGHYNNLTVNGPLTITPGNTDLNIVVNTLVVSNNGSLVIGGTGTGRVIIHVIRSVDLHGTVGSTTTVNRLQVIQHGDRTVNIGGTPTDPGHFHGTLITNVATIRIDHSATLSGLLITNSTEREAIRIRNDASVGTATEGVLFYAPNGRVDIDNHSSVFGVVVANDLNVGYATLTLNRIITTPFFPFVSFGGGATYPVSNWNERR